MTKFGCASVRRPRRVFGTSAPSACWTSLRVSHAVSHDWRWNRGWSSGPACWTAGRAGSRRSPSQQRIVNSQVNVGLCDQQSFGFVRTAASAHYCPARGRRSKSTASATFWLRDPPSGGSRRRRAIDRHCEHVFGSRPAAAAAGCPSWIVERPSRSARASTATHADTTWRKCGTADAARCCQRRDRAQAVPRVRHLRGAGRAGSGHRRRRGPSTRRATCVVDRHHGSGTHAVPSSTSMGRVASGRAAHRSCTGSEVSAKKSLPLSSTTMNAGKSSHLDPPHRFHAELGVLEHLDLA